jgi:hypothetical protein
MDPKFRCIRSTPSALQSIRENDFECFANTGVSKWLLFARHMFGMVKLKSSEGEW